jgi:DNA-binding IclR family transcriptional regulator
VRALVRAGGLATGGLAEEAGVDEERAERLLEGLERDGLVSRDGAQGWRVAD